MFFVSQKNNSEQNKSKIDRSFLISLISNYIDGLVLNHFAGMMIPSMTGVIPKSIKPDLTRALILLEEAIVEKKCALVLFTLINLPNDDELSADDLQRKMRSKLEGESSEWLLSIMDQSLLKVESTTRTIALLEDSYAKTPEIFNDPGITFRLKESILADLSVDCDICEAIANDILSNKRCPTDKILLEQSKYQEITNNPV